MKVVGGTDINGHVTINRGVTIGGGGGVLNVIGAGIFNSTLTGATATFSKLLSASNGISTGTLYTSLISPRGVTVDIDFIPGTFNEGAAALGFRSQDALSNTFTTFLNSSIATATRTVTIPNESGTIALRGANTFTGLQTLTAGLSAAGGITLNGAVTGATATFSRLLTANAGISATGITLAGGSSIKFDGTNAIGYIDGVSSIRLGQNTVRTIIGDYDQVGNATSIYLRDNAAELDVLNPSGDLRLGDPDGINNAIYLTISNASSAIDIGGDVNQQFGDFTSVGRVTGQSGVAIGAGAISAKTSGYTLTAADNGKVITFNSASALVCGVDTAAGATGYSCTVIQLGTGGVRFARSGVTLNSYNGLTLAGQHAAASLVCYQTNILNVSGNLVA